MSNERVKWLSGSRRVLISEIEGDGLFVATPAPKLGIPVTEEQAMRLALKENAKGQVAPGYDGCAINLEECRNNAFGRRDEKEGQKPTLPLPLPPQSTS